MVAQRFLQSPAAAWHLAGPMAEHAKLFGFGGTQLSSGTKLFLPPSLSANPGSCKSSRFCSQHLGAHLQDLGTHTLRPSRLALPPTLLRLLPGSLGFQTCMILARERFCVPVG